MHLLGVLLWPLGWAVTALITRGILDFKPDQSIRFFELTAPCYSSLASFGVPVAAFWNVFGSIAAALRDAKLAVAG